MSTKSGFITLLGRPNAGKSTLLNALLKEKVAIMSNKPQTTRDVIQGILTKGDTQFIFIDTPGVHKPQHELGRQMSKAALSSAYGVDVIYFLADATSPYGRGDEFILNNIKEYGVP
ncbi:MAG: GTPase Era, partial [Erysipelotrichales bacterium]|nr:GTPase Era [Erysipelotrichales bacterium]